MTANPLSRLRAVESAILARRPEHSVDPSLDRIAALVNLLGDPQRAYPVIHITGTNGKTSTARMTETLLRARGLRTGLFTSPHLATMRERICVDGEPLSAERFIEAYDEIEPYLDLVDSSQPVRLSFFEVFVGMAFAVFADAPVDVAVIEVGMGGTWDSTNVADGAVAVITPVAVDHQQYLGTTVAEIAADKAGIIKPGSVAVLGRQPAGAAAALLRRVAAVGATVAREGLEFAVLRRELALGGQQLAIRGLLGEYHDLFLPLFGAHQAGNAACALAAVEAFAGAAPQALAAGAAGDADRPGNEMYPAAGSSPVSPRLLPPELVQVDMGKADGPESGQAEQRLGALDPGMVREAFALMSSPGRLEIIRRGPVVIADAAHNPAGMAATVAALTEAFSFSELVVILAVSEDKDVAGILDQLEPVAAHLVVTSNSSARSMPAQKLGDLASTLFSADRLTVANRLDEAIEAAIALADQTAAGAPGGSGVLITGSVVTAGDARQLLAASPWRPADGAVAGDETAELEGTAGEVDGE